MASTIRIAILANGTQAKREFKDVSKASKKMGAKFSDLSKNAARITGVMAGVSSAIGPVTTGVLAAAKGAVVLGKALSATGATAAAFGPSVAGAFGLIKGTALIAGPAITKAFEPVIAQFRATDKETGALAKRVQDLASRGLKPLAEQFVKVNLPTIGSAMERIATAMNGVIVSTGKWLNSTAGQSLIRTISEGTAKAMERLAPKVSAVVISFGNLANRAGDKALTGLADVIGRILDKIKEWADSTSTKDIQDNLDSLAGFGQKVKDAFLFLRDVGRWMQENEGKVKAISDALGVLGIALAIFAGGPILGAIAGALSILINHWDEVKRVFEAAKTWWDQTWKALNANANFAAFKKAIGDFINAVIPPLKSMWEQIQKEVSPKIQELKDTIMNEVVPALTGFINAMRPIVVFLLEKVGPVVATTFGAVVDIIKGALKIVSGIINIFTGILTGDWKKVWEGVKGILRGAWDIIVALVRVAIARARAAFEIGVAALQKVASGIGGKIKSGLGNLASLLYNAGRDVVLGLINGIKSMAGAAVNAAKGVVSDAVGGAKRLLGIASPSKVFRQIGVYSGQGLALGLEASRRTVQAAANSLLSIPSAQSAQVAMTQTVDLNAQAAALRTKADITLSWDSAASTGDPILDAMIEGLRKRVRVSGGNVQAVLGR